MAKRVAVTVLAAAGAVLALVWSAPGGELVEHHGLKIDADSGAMTCLSCHDGRMGKGGTVCLTKCDFRSPHALLRQYPPLGKEDQFAPLASLPGKGIRLEDGRISCISCHDLTNPGKDHLVMSNNGSRLCLSCHVK